MQMLAPHVRRALLTQWRLAGARLEKLFHGAALESLGYGLAVVDEARKVYYLNRRAETLLRSNTGLVLRGGCLHAENPETDHALKRLVQDASKGMGGGIAVAVMPAREAIHRQAAQYGLSAIPLKEEAAISELARFARLPGRGVLLLIQDPLRVDAQAGLMPFAARHRITPAELRVLERLVAGLAPKQIADQFGLRISTVRTQLSQLFLKTSTRNQRELVSLALRSGGGQQ
jgi:DNA-binding CsgD family transcriptional regulator